jgi:(p)ppGpp synthase/HD superfamily hydrolase
VRPEPPKLTDRFRAAVELASEVHGEDRRKGTLIPYLAHLLVVAGLVLEDGGDEDEAIAAMLHDAVDDGGDPAMLERIRREFGERVATIVDACSEGPYEEPKPPWRERKERYVAQLPSVRDDGALRVSLADKVHNARSIVRAQREEGDALWARFATKTPADVLWYYDLLAGFFAERHPGPLAEDLRIVVKELSGLLEGSAGGDPVARDAPGVVG